MDRTATAPPRGWMTSPVLKWLQVPVVAGIVLFLAFVGLSFVNDPKGTLSTDVGGKVATLRVMDARGTDAPEVGYWAAAGDPEADLHGLYYTSLVGDHYVNVTTVPVIELARPLYAWAGYRAALLWSMIGAVAAAFAARALARRAGADDARAWAAFWLTGARLAGDCCTPSTCGSTLSGLALMAWGVVALVDTAARRSRWTALAGGSAFGAAFSMRTEAAVYGFVVVAVGCVLIWRRRNLVAAVTAGVLAAAGVRGHGDRQLRPRGGGARLSLRAGRSSGAAGGGGSDLAVRFKEALTTTVGLFPSTDPGQILLGGIAAGLLAWAVWRVLGRGDHRVARIAAAGAVVLFLLRAADGLGFRPRLPGHRPVRGGRRAARLGTVG